MKKKGAINKMRTQSEKRRRNKMLNDKIKKNKTIQEKKIKNNNRENKYCI